MSIIEQAAARLSELRASGADIPARVGIDAAAAAGLAPARRARGLVHDIDGLRPWRPTGRAAAPLSPPVDAPPPAARVAIDLARLAREGYLVPGGERSRLADEMRVVKRPLLDRARAVAPSPADRSNLVMVTSACPGEGKTFVAVNLALSMAMELDLRVLLVDADVTRPAVLQRLGLSPAPGLLDVLTDPDVPLQARLLATNVERLSVLAAGSARGEATELLASDGLTRLLDELALRERGLVVVFDAPPLLPSTEARVLAAQMGQIVLVVEADRTPQAVLRQALATLQQRPVVLPLLNKASRSEVGEYDGY